MTKPEAIVTWGTSLDLFRVSSSVIRVSSSREIVNYLGGKKGGGQKGGLRRQRGARIKQGRGGFSSGFARERTKIRSAKTAGRTMIRKGKKIETESAANRNIGPCGENAPRLRRENTSLMRLFYFILKSP